MEKIIITATEIAGKKGIKITSDNNRFKQIYNSIKIKSESSNNNKIRERANTTMKKLKEEGYKVEWKYVNKEKNNDY